MLYGWLIRLALFLEYDLEAILLLNMIEVLSGIRIVATDGSEKRMGLSSSSSCLA